MHAPITETKVSDSQLSLFNESIFHDVFPIFLNLILKKKGISVGCYDIYKYNIDCQWIDISEIDFGQYTFRVAINGEHKGLCKIILASF